MLSLEQIQQLQQQLLEDIISYKLSDDEVNEQIYLYLENIAGFEFLDEQSLAKIVSDIKKCLGSST